MASITVMALVQGGVVQFARASEGVAFEVCDLDNMAGCAGGLDGQCADDEHPSDRECHENTRDQYKAYKKLAEGVY